MVKMSLHSSLCLFVYEKAGSYSNTHLPLHQLFQVLPVSLLVPQLLFLPAAQEDQVFHKCLHPPTKRGHKLKG